MLIGAPIGYVEARHRSRLSGLLDFVGMVFAVSGTILAIGLIIAFNSGPLILTGGWLIVVIAYVVRKLPFAIRSSSAIVHQLDPSLEEASKSQGASKQISSAGARSGRAELSRSSLQKAYVSRGPEAGEDG